jgi:creatinine amidohydrolase
MHLTAATTTDETARQATVALLPIGSFEQHGSHLPLTTDTIVACAVARQIAERYPVLLLPPITISCSHEHANWAGTVSISSTTLSAIVRDVCLSLDRQGVKSLVLVNGHGGNYVLSNVVQEHNVEGPRMALYPGRDDWERARVSACLSSHAHEDMHAGEVETSLLLHVAPEQVRPGFQDADEAAADRPYLLVLGMEAYTQSGVIGFPSQATPEKGAKVLASLTDGFSAVLDVLDAGASR